MHLLWIAVLIQTLFFIVNDAHFYVLTFIGLSLILQAFSKNSLVFLLGPMIIVHLLFMYWPVKEGFRKFKKPKKPKIKSVKKTANKSSKTVKKTAKKASKGINKGVSVMKKQATNTYNSTKKLGDATINAAQSAFKNFEEITKNTGGGGSTKMPQNNNYNDEAEIKTGPQMAKITGPGEFPGKKK